MNFVNYLQTNYSSQMKYLNIRDSGILILNLYTVAVTCQKRILCVGLLVGTPSGHIGMTMYAQNLSFALILLAILRATSIGIKLFAPEDIYEKKLGFRRCYQSRKVNLSFVFVSL